MSNVNRNLLEKEVSQDPLQDERVEVELSSDEAGSLDAERRVSQKCTRGLDSPRTKRYAPD